jgi:hypothetical protein
MTAVNHQHILQCKGKDDTEFNVFASCAHKAEREGESTSGRMTATMSCWRAPHSA